MIEPQRWLEADRAIEHVLPVAGAVGMVVGELDEAAAAQVVGARVADVQHVRRAAGHDERGECGGGAFELRVGLPLLVQPAVDGLERMRGIALRAQGLRQRVVAVEQAVNRNLGGGAPALRAAHAVRDRDDVTTAQRVRPLRDAVADEVLVRRPLALLGGVVDADLRRSSRCGHCWPVLKTLQCRTQL